MVNACLLLLGFVVGVEFYFTALPGPMSISRLQAAQLGLRNWFPWVVLSPAVIAWAAVFGFERKTWRRSLLAHCAACIAVVLFYEALQTWLFPQPAAGIFGAPPPPPPGLNSPRVAERANADPSHPARSASTDAPGPSRLGMNPLRPSMLQRAAFKTQFTIPIYWCIVCVCWGLNHLQESRERERRALELEARLAEANLRVLKMQLQPHFLFNALHAIASLIHENPKAADDMIGALSQFLRMNLEASAENEVALERELEFVDRYLQIQQARFGERLRFQRDIEPAARDAMVPPFILQPLVENSIQHGHRVSRVRWNRASPRSQKRR